MALPEEKALRSNFFNQSLFTKLNQMLDILVEAMQKDYQSQLQCGLPCRVAVNYQEIINLPSALEENLLALVNNILLESNPEVQSNLENYITIAFRLKWIQSITEFWQKHDTTTIKSEAEQRIKKSIKLGQLSNNPETKAKLLQQQQRDITLIKNMQLPQFYQSERVQLIQAYNRSRVELLSKINAVSFEFADERADVQDLSKPLQFN